MTTFLFWNLNKKPLQNTIAKLAQQHQVDVLMFAECDIEPTILLNSLNHYNPNQYYYAPARICKKIEIFTKFESQFVTPTFESDRTTIRHLKLPKKTSVLLAVTHFYSKLYLNNAEQAFKCLELTNQIRKAEKNIGHYKTILVGDLNMNPFEHGLIAKEGLHAVMSKDIISHSRNKTYQFFYNPMWNLFGDESESLPGTYYYPKDLYWNMFDQVLIRPDLLDKFNNKELKIINKVGKKSLLSSTGRPNKNLFSDHLPILFSLQL